MAASPLSDASYAVTNTGNTSSSYRVKVVGVASDAPRPLRLLVTKVQRSPASAGCALVESSESTVLLDVVDPVIESPSDTSEAPVDEQGSADATFALRPGETAYVTLRGRTDPDRMEEIAQAVVPVIIPQAGESDYAAPLVMALAGNRLPAGRYGVPYSVDLEAFGGKKPYSWSGSVPPGLTLGMRANKGVISGVPLAVGDHEVPLRVDDSGPTSTGVTRSFILSIGRARTTVKVAAPAAVQVGERVSVSVSVLPEGAGTPSGSVDVGEEGGESCPAPAPAGGCTLAFTKAGPGTIGATYEGDDRFEGASATATPIEVAPAATSEPPPVAEPPVAEPPVAEPPVAEPPVAEPPVAEPPVAEADLVAP